MTATSPQTAGTTHRPPTIDETWLALHREPVIAPEQIIVDPHQHLWARATQNYMEAEALADLASGHRIVATVFVECWSGYRTTGPEHLRPVGETEFAAAMARTVTIADGSCDFIAGIVGHADLTDEERLDEVLLAHIEAGRGRFRGIRHAVQHDAAGSIPVVRKAEPGLLLTPAFQRGVARLADHGLSFDAWLYQTQLDELILCAHAAPQTTIVLDHLGGPLAIGAYVGRRAEMSAQWRASMGRLAACRNVVVKIGGLGMSTAGHGFHTLAAPPSSERMADAMRDDVLGRDRDFWTRTLHVRG